MVRRPGRRGSQVVCRHLRQFKDLNIARYGEAGYEVHGKPAGTVMAVTFELGGQAFCALNGGPQFRFNEAISFQVRCETQEEVDYYWAKLSEGGDEKAQQAAGSRTSTASPGRSSAASCSRCSTTPTPQDPSGS